MTYQVSEAVKLVNYVAGGHAQRHTERERIQRTTEAFHLAGRLQLTQPLKGTTPPYSRIRNEGEHVGPSLALSLDVIKHRKARGERERNRGFPEHDRTSDRSC